MNYFQRLYKFCDYRWLWILLIIISIIATKAERNTFKDFFDSYFANNTDYNKWQSLSSPNTEIVVLNSTQRSASRPSTILKQFWTSASKADNHSIKLLSNDKNDVSSQSFSVKLKDFLFRPTKWSSDIVPSIPLSLQLSSDAIKLSPHVKEGKSTTNGDITVINGFSSSISYPPKDFPFVSRNQKNSYESKPDVLESIITTSTPILTTDGRPTDVPLSLESIKNEVSLPFIDVKINTTSIPFINNTIPPKIITTTATIVSSTEPQKRSGELLYPSPTFTTFRSIQTTQGLTQKPKMSPQELRRQAIRQRFGTSNPNFGARISRTPPKVSIDNFLSVYKPTLKNQYTIKSRVNARNENSTKVPKIIKENNSVKPKLLIFNNTNEISIKNRTNQMRNHLMTAEKRDTLSGLLLFPSRPIPMLKPRLSNSTEGYGGLKDDFVKHWFKYSQRDPYSGGQNKKNVSAVPVERKIDQKSIETHAKKSQKYPFGYRQKVFDDSNINNNNNNNNNFFSENPTDLELFEDPSAHGLPLESIMNPQFNSEEMPLILGEGHFIPTDEFMDTQKHYINQLKLEEENMKYKKLPNPDLFKNELNKPETDGEESTFEISPIDSTIYKKPKKVKPTLPNNVMKFEEMMRHLASVLRSINRLNPIGRKISDKYKEMSTKIKFDLMSDKSKGPYAKYYPPGPYDDIYSPDPVEEKYRRSDEDIPSPQINERYDQTEDNTFIDRMDDINTDNNNSYAFNDYDNDGLIKKSFGYRVTVYRSPEKGESNVTEEVLDDDNDLNGNKSDDLSVSESSDEFSVTTDTNNNGTEYLMTSASNLLRGESQSGLKGNAKGANYKRNKYDREKGSHAKEEVNTNKSKKVDTHDRRANNEKALKERTIIEFFEREHILDTAYNKDKLGIDKTDTNNANDDQHTSGSMPKTVILPENTIPKNGTLKVGEAHEFANSDHSHVTNAQTFDTIFPEHDRKYKHKDNAHKYKGWKERGYKIITETEFVDRGRKMDTGYKKHINGSQEHIKEKSAGDVTKADFRKYNKNIKNITKSTEALYGKRFKPSQNNYGKDAKDKVLMNADDYRKYYYNNGMTSGESQVSEEHKPYDSTQHTQQQSAGPTADPNYVSTYDTIRTSEQPLGQLQIEGITPEDIIQDVSTQKEELVSTEETPTEDKSEKTYTDNDLNDKFTTDNFQPPPVDTENYWRPITSTAYDQNNNNQDYNPKPRPYNNYINYNNGNNVYPNDNTNENYDQNFENGVNTDININKGIPTISSENYGSGNNPYSMPLVSEEVHSNPNSNNAGINPNIPQLYKNEEYFYEPIRNSGSKRPQNHFFNENQQNKYNNQNAFKPPNDIKYENHRNYNSFFSNITNQRPIFDSYPEPQLTPNPYPQIPEIMPTPQALVPTNQPYYNYQVYPPAFDQNQIQSQLEKVPKGRPLFGIIGDESKKIENINHMETVRHRNTNNKFNDNGMNIKNAQNMKNVNHYKHTLTTPLPLIKETQNYIRPIRLNTMIPAPIPVPQPMWRDGPKQSKKKRRKPGVYPAPPLMNPAMNHHFMNPNSFQTFLGPISNFPLQLKLPLKLRSTSLPPTHLLAFEPSLSGSRDRPVAILHPNKVLTLTSANLLKGKYKDHFASASNNHHLVINPKNLRGKKRPSKRGKKLKIKWGKLRQKRRSFKEMFTFKNWFKSNFES